MKATFFATPSDFKKWLENNYKTETELLVGYYKVHTKKPTMSWSESVDQALCYGWIDGIRRKIDDESYSIRFTPRRKDSLWSMVNIKKVEKLKKSGLMTEDGLKAYSYVKSDKSNVYSHDEIKLVELSLEYETIFKENQSAWEFFKDQAPSYRKGIIHWIMSAKQEKTRISRLEKAISASKNQKRIY